MYDRDLPIIENYLGIGNFQIKLKFPNKIGDKYSSYYQLVDTDYLSGFVFC